MTADEHWAENYCDTCARPMHPNHGAICARCVHEVEFTEWMRGWVA